MSVADATGNSTQYTFDPTMKRGEFRFPGLCTREPAWKLRAEFARADPLRAKPDFALAVTGVPVPGSGRASFTNATARGAGMTVRLLGVAGAGEIEWSPGQPEVRSGGGSYARLAVTPPGGGLQITLAGATDERGRSLMPARRGPPELGSLGSYSQIQRPLVLQPGQYDFDLKIPRNAKRLNLRFVFHRTHAVQFLATP